jgi:hypothetical protein
MSYESGVKDAVKSFHRNLPIEKMRCDLLPQKIAVWRYEMGEKYSLKLSDEAVFILMEKKELKMKNIKTYYKPIRSFICVFNNTCGTDIVVTPLKSTTSDGILSALAPPP